MNDIPCLYENRTTYNQEAYRALVKLMMGKMRRWPRMAVLTLGIGTLVLAGYQMFTSSSFNIVSILFIIFGDALIVFAVFAEYFLVQMLLSQTGRKNQLVNCYRFYPDYMEIAPINGEPSRISYGQISRILEYGQYYFLFTDGKNAYIINPSSMSRGTRQELRTFLEEKLQK